MNSCIYGKYEKPHIVEHGVYKGRHWCIRMFSNPCAYVSKETGDSNKVIGEKVHGGITYEGTLPNSENQEIMFPYCNIEYWGWDYAHYGDFVSGSLFQQGKKDKKWTSEEIIKEIYDAIDALDKRRAKMETRYIIEGKSRFSEYITFCSFSRERAVKILQDNIIKSPKVYKIQRDGTFKEITMKELFSPSYLRRRTNGRH